MNGLRLARIGGTRGRGRPNKAWLNGVKKNMTVRGLKLDTAFKSDQWKKEI
jgi:hypothetical protein